MNIIDYGIIILLFLFVIKGFKAGLLPSIVNFCGMFLVFILSFYLKGPVSIFLYERLPFISFGGIFKGVIAINILFYEVVAYLLTFMILSIIFAIVKKISKLINNIFEMTILLNIPSKIIGGVIGALEGILFCFIALLICSYISNTAILVNDSKYGSIILNNVPIIDSVTNKLVNSGKEVYDTVLKNKKDKNKANLESIDILMKYDILSYESANKLVKDNKLNIKNVSNVIDKYKEEK